MGGLARTGRRQVSGSREYGRIQMGQRPPSPNNPPGFILLPARRGLAGFTPANVHLTFQLGYTRE